MVGARALRAELRGDRVGRLAVLFRSAEKLAFMELLPPPANR